MIIGLTGKNGSGKGEVVKFHKERGFHALSLSDGVREELKRRRKPITRKSLIAVGNEMRRQFGSSVLADRLISKLHSDKNYVVDSIRNPYEAKALQKIPGFVLLDVVAAQRVRFERVRSRRRERDPQGFKEFVRLERIESESADSTTQQLDETAKLANICLRNDGTIPQLHERIKKLLAGLVKKNKRPGWDEYFMSIARVVAMRSNCLKRKVAAVIVKDKRIISTGYNGTPRGVANCNEGGCPRCASFESSGERLGECLCSHAEENAITQAAYHGVSIKGSTLYTTYSPCLMCTKMIINSGICEVVYHVDYSLDPTSLKLLKEAEVIVRQLTHD